jgi:hypothetical protein
VILMAAGTLSVRAFPVAQVMAAPSAVNCAGLELHVAPGLHPPSPNYPFRPAPDAPRTPFTVATPLYPGLIPLQHLAGSPFAEIQDSPYLQTASAELHSTASSDTVQAWYERTMNSCGWRADGSWNGNAGAFPYGISFTRGPTGALNTGIDVGFADESDGSTDVALAVEAVRYPAPPAAARIHGSFVQLRIALSRSGQGSPGPARTVHAVVTNRRVIARLVGVIDGISAAYTVPTTCFGGLRTTGPAWLTFVRADESQVHAFEAGPGVCGGLAVNGFRWLLDPGTVWSLILPLTTGRR